MMMMLLLLGDDYFLTFQSSYTNVLLVAEKPFDSSYDREEPLNMIVGEVGIKGWDDGVYKACVGEVSRASSNAKD